jgi:putative FmdB family regulatory protein
MPIYEYKCQSCGMRKDILRKMSDPPLTVCPECGKETLQKMVTAAGFQLKGTGWYATDFKGPPKTAGGSDGASASGDAKADTKSDAKAETKADAKSDTKADTKTESKPAPKTDSAASTT